MRERCVVAHYIEGRTGGEDRIEMLGGTDA